MVHDDGPVGLDGLKVQFDDERPSRAPVRVITQTSPSDSTSRELGIVGNRLVRSLDRVRAVMAESALWSRFFPENPYEGFSVDGMELDLQGWGSNDPIFRHLITSLQPETIIEVGSWKGASAVNMANIAGRIGLDAQIICVDTWLGSPEHFFRRDHPAYWDSLRIRHGFPRLYEQFLANIVHSGHEDRIVPLPQTSTNAARILSRLGISAKLIYIDGAHEYRAVLDDLNSYGPLTAPGGVMFGDDFGSAPVKRAAIEYAAEQGLKILSTEMKYALVRDSTDLTWPPA